MLMFADLFLLSHLRMISSLLLRWSVLFSALGQFVPVLFAIDLLESLHPFEHRPVLQVAEQEPLAEPVPADDVEDHGESAAHHCCLFSFISQLGI